MVERLGTRWIVKIKSEKPSYVQGDFMRAYEDYIEEVTGERVDIQCAEVKDANTKRDGRMPSDDGTNT